MLILQTGYKRKKNKSKKYRQYKCFQYAVTVEEIESHPERISSIKPFISKYNWKGINCPSEIDDWKTFEKNNPTFTLNILYVKKREICPAYISEINSNCEK